MPAFSAYPLCCGAYIASGFEMHPNHIIGQKTERCPKTYVLIHVKDKDGKVIPITASDKFKTDLEAKIQGFAGASYQCILTERQITAYPGWLEIIKSMGFEFVRRWSNSIHQDREYLYLFVLCTDRKGKCEGDFTQPPKGWEAMPGPVQEEPAGSDRDVTIAKAA